MKLKISSTIIASILMLSVCSNSMAANPYNDHISIMRQYGYTSETAAALPVEDQQEVVDELLKNPGKVDICTMTLEVDTLSEIESFFSYTDEEMIAMGADASKLEETREELEALNDMSDKELAEELKITTTESKLFHRAVQKGKNNKKRGNYHGKKSGVNASGSITSSEMSYTQNVTDNSTSTKPNYSVKLSYTWKQVYWLACFNDTIVAAWGGGLNTKGISSSAKYNKYFIVGGSFGSYVMSESMSKEQVAQAGIKFTFPQSIQVVPNNDESVLKTEKGYAKFTLYQTKKQGYDTKLLSNYCHKVISLAGATIGINATGPSVSISISTAYDKTPQKASTLSY